MEDPQADYLLSSEDNGRGGIFDWPLRFVLSKLSGVEYSHGGKKKSSLVKASERKSLYSARYFRYTVILFLLYILSGIGYYSGHMGYTLLDSVYFIIVSFYTVGFGDYVPETESQRLFTTFFVTVGFALLCVIGVTAGDFFHNAVKLHSSARTKRVLDMITQARFDMTSRDGALHTAADDVSERGTMESRDSNVSRASRASAGRKVPSRRLSLMNQQHNGDIFPSPYSISDPRVIELMRKVNMDMFDEELEAIKHKTKKDFFMILVILFLGSLCMGFIEDWAAADALYWSCVTITTIGFGDVTPDSDAGKVFTIFYCLLGIGLMAKAVTDLASYPFLMREKKTELQVLMQFGTELSEEQLSMIQNHELINAVPKLRKSRDRVEKSEFVLILLQLMDKVQDTDIVYISEIFDALDKNGEGHLSDQELATKMQQARTRAMTAVSATPTDNTTSRSSIGSLMSLFNSSSAEPRPSTSYASFSGSAVPFSTAPTTVNGAGGSYQPPAAPPRAMYRGTSSPSVLGAFRSVDSEQQVEDASTSIGSQNVPNSNSAY